MKGISAVIATILLLLIVIAIVGFAFGFFQRLFTTTSSTAEQQTNALTQQAQQVLRIDNAAGSTLVLRAIGSADVPTASVTYYVNGQLDSCTFAPPIGGGSGTGLIPAGTVQTCTLTTACTTGQPVRVTAPGSDNTFNCA